MLDVIVDSLLDTLKLFPFLLLIYIVIELLEHKTELTGANGGLNGKLGPLIGSATGLIPQCGFSVMAAKLFEQKFITLGTLFAIFLSTSDEAFVILLSSGTGAIYLLPLIVVKFFVGVAVGYAVDGVVHAFSSKKNLKSTGGEAFDNAHELFINKKERETGCTSCGRTHDDHKPVKTYFLSPLLHSAKVAGMIFLVNFALGVIIDYVTEERFSTFMQQSAFAQPFITALIGLIPNCASSVVITECFLQKGILFGSCVAGLCANAGLGFVVLLKNTKEWKRNLLLIAISYLVSVAVGLLLNLIQI